MRMISTFYSKVSSTTKGLIFFLLFFSNSSSAQLWYEFPSDLPYSWHLGFYIANNDTFYTCTNSGQVYRSANGGINWTEVYAPSGIILQAIHFPTNDVGYIAGSNDTYLKSTDGGVTWVPQNLSGLSSSEVYFIDENIGFLSGDGIWKTTNGGANWNQTNLPVGGYGEDVCFIDNSIGYIAGGNIVVKTSDQGGSWSTIRTGPSGVYYRAVDFYDENLGIVVGWTENILRTTDGGVNWTVITPPVVTGNIYDVNFIDANNVYAIAWDYILHSSDGGLTWVSEYITDPQVHHHFDVTPSGKRFVFGDELFTDDADCSSPLPIPMITQNGTSLQASSGFISYEWFFNGIPIPGSNLSEIIISQNGTYTVTGTYANSCPYTSNSFIVNNISIEEIKLLKELTLYPNPTNSYIQIPQNFQSVLIYSLSGEVVFQTANSDEPIYVGDLPKGLYMIKAIDDKGMTFSTKLVIE